MLKLTTNVWLVIFTWSSLKVKRAWQEIRSGRSGECSAVEGKDPRTYSLSLTLRNSLSPHKELGASLISCKMNWMISGRSFSCSECEIDLKRRGWLWPIGPHNMTIHSKCKLHKYKLIQRKGIRTLCVNCLRVVVQFICQISDGTYFGTERRGQLASLGKCFGDF